MYKVMKRDGTVAEFDIAKISRAITKSFDAVNVNYHPTVIDLLALKVTSDFAPKIKNDVISVEMGSSWFMGGVFNGSIMTEVIFGYPGVGKLIQKAITMSDYNMILATITISIIAISTMTFIVDLILPLFDPRIRYA